MNDTTAHGETILWEPEADAMAGLMGRFLAAAAEECAVDLPDYRSALAWSTDDIAGFWDRVRRWFDLVGDWRGPVLTDERMPGAKWFPLSRLNYAENVLRHARGALASQAAIVDIDEHGHQREMSWRDLSDRVASVAASLRRLGVRRGDRVVAVLPNAPEAIIGLLASASIGATWCICSPDLSATATVARLGQLDPKVLIGSLGYRYGGKWFDRRDHLDEIVARLPSLEHVIEVGQDTTRMSFAELTAEQAEPGFDRVPFDHPLWVLFTSGTTGSPKGIVHGHGGMALEAVKAWGLQFEMTPEDRYYVAANTSWMVWNTLLASLMSGASIVTYAGSPTFPRVDRQFEIVANSGATMFGTGAAYLKRVQEAGRYPGGEYDLSALRLVMSTGSTLADATANWLHDTVGARARLADTSGGTDICSAFVGGNPLEPVRLGRMQGAFLGVALDVFDESGKSLRDTVGELVITRPMPAMPVSFWNDPDGARYRAAYFEAYPDVWTHGDWITLSTDGTCEILGRSDATLNRHGIRLGSSEIYGALQPVSGVLDGLVIGVELPAGGYWLPLFVELDQSRNFDDALRERITTAIRSNASPRHVPDEIIPVPAIPVTHTGKKVELPIKRLFAGADPDAIDRGALANPEAMDWYIDRAREFLASTKEKS
ncbi:acetoacetate--CoA ligase [Amycolatopsis pithecellobii]|uniref:Acetoacetate--CoA ligase n=1 Tax=Amycolatopsis pithecellobii TaxID=664692 RepID=A0A6N7Z7Z6_9PSEU|nr:acetoacetate--CoA ligase [Amycolatopsis pithecellobii]MTD57574.1 acetoacetate--CoA ligase [Amycolatopsis pithecellobii]